MWSDAFGGQLLAPLAGLSGPPLAPPPKPPPEPTFGVALDQRDGTQPPPPPHPFTPQRL